MLTFRIMVRKGLLDPNEVNSLVRKEIASEIPHQPESLKFIPESAWAAVKGLEQIKIFEHLLNQMDSEPHLWRKWYVDERPESVELPKSVKDISLFYRTGIEKFMPYSFKVVDKFSDKIMEQERRAVYTTPKSFLELIKLFKSMQTIKEGDLINTKEKYETGVIKLQETGEVVAKLEDELKIFSVEVEAKKKTADEQAEIVGGEKAKVEAQNAVAEEEAAKCAVIKVNVEA